MRSSRSITAPKNHPSFTLNSARPRSHRYMISSVPTLIDEKVEPSFASPVINEGPIKDDSANEDFGFADNENGLNIPKTAVREKISAAQENQIIQKNSTIQALPVSQTNTKANSSVAGTMSNDHAIPSSNITSNNSSSGLNQTNSTIDNNSLNSNESSNPSINNNSSSISATNNSEQSAQATNLEDSPQILNPPKSSMLISEPANKNVISIIDSLKFHPSSPVPLIPEHIPPVDKISNEINSFLEGKDQPAQSLNLSTKSKEDGNKIIVQEADVTRRRLDLHNFKMEFDQSN